MENHNFNNDLSEGQKEFLREAERRGINRNLFKGYIPKVSTKESIRNNLPTIAYIHTGGTLAMTKSVKNEGAISFENAVDLNETLNACDYIAEIRNKFNTIGIPLANIDSKELKPDAWTAMAATIKAIYDKVDGVVIGHGTHTLEYSAAAIAYSLRNLSLPIVFASSQIPLLGHLGSDGFQNLTGAMGIAANGNFGETLVYSDGFIHRGTRVTKENDSRLNIFESKVTGPIGHFAASGIEVGPGARTRNQKRKHELIFQPEFDPSVLIVKINPSMTSDMLINLLNNAQNNAVGAILETYGSGAISDEFIPILKSKMEEGLPIFLTSSAGQSGISVGMNNHDDAAIEAYKNGIRNTGDMSTSAAAVKLMNIVAQNGFSEDPKERLIVITNEMIKKSYAGEITIPSKVESDF